MPQKVVIAEQVRIAALLTDERVDELIVAQGRYQIGDVFLGTIENVLPGIDAAFVNIGASEKNGFIHVTDLGPLKLKKNAAGINELLEPRQKVLVQVMKEPTGSKGPRLTGNISLPGRYLVLQPNSQGVNISRRINTETERNRLRALGVLIKPPGTGLLMRSEAEGISEELLISDLESLLKQWDSIQQAAENSNPPILLNREEDFIHRVLRDNASAELQQVIVETESAVERAKSFLGKNSDVTIEAHQEPTNLLEHYKVHTTIFNCLKPRVDLPSGGYIIIEPTEALTVIDVNSGSFTRSSNSRETVLWTNCEAAIEIARQLKLRNIGGVIIIDFIDMESRRDQLQLLEYFTAAIKNDTSRPQIAQLTELGLVELTRKRQGQNIYELFSKTCSTCNGLGQIANIPGKEEIQPLAAIGGLIQKEDTSKKINPTNTKDQSNSKQKSNNNTASENLSVITSNNAESINQESNSEANINKKDPDIITVNMSPEEEYVFSSLGLNPILLLDPQPENDNVLVHVVRPGENATDVLEDAIQQVSNNPNKRRKKTKNTMSRTSSEVSLESQASLNNEEVAKESELEVLEGNKIGQKNEDTEGISTSNDESLIIEGAQIDNDGEVDDSRRRRRRSSASN